MSKAEKIAIAITILLISFALSFLWGLIQFWTPAAIAETQAVCVVTKGEWVWVRDAPDPEAKQIEKIRWGYEVGISEIRNGYAHINSEYHGAGWVDVSYLEIPIAETIYKVISDGALNVRETPEGRFLRKIKAGVNVSVLGWRYSKSGELWAKVYKGGYVKAMYLEQAIR